MMRLHQTDRPLTLTLSPRGEGMAAGTASPLGERPARALSPETNRRQSFAPGEGAV